MNPPAPAMLVIFSHGKESGPWGSKIRALADVAERLGAQVMSVNYREDPVGTPHDHDAAGEPQRRVQQLLATPRPASQRLVLVGSSMGGFVSTVASMTLCPEGLFLLAPALGLPGYDHPGMTTGAKTTMLVHGWGDEVVPVAGSIRFAQAHGCDLVLLEGDHRLNDALPKIEPLFELFLKRVMAL